MNSPIYKNQGPTAKDFKNQSKYKFGEQCKLPMALEGAKEIMEKHNSHLDDVPDIFSNEIGHLCPYSTTKRRKTEQYLYCVTHEVNCNWLYCATFKKYLKENNMEEEAPYLFDKKTAPPDVA